MGMFDCVKVNDITFLKEDTPPILPGMYQTKCLEQLLDVYEVEDFHLLNKSKKEDRNREIKNKEIRIYRVFSSESLEEDILTLDDSRIFYWLNLFRDCATHGAWLEYSLNVNKNKIKKINSIGSFSKKYYEAKK